MPRPSKKEERTEQILQAFQRCVARYGLEGSSLERVAEESGLQRSLVRHFVGNRNELIKLLALRVIEESEKQWQEVIYYLPEKHTMTTLLDILFSNEENTPNELSMVVLSLIFASSQDDFLKTLMKGWMTRFINDMSEILQYSFPKSDSKQRETVAFGIVSIYLNLDSQGPIDLIESYRMPSRQAADILVASLHNTGETS